MAIVAATLTFSDPINSSLQIGDFIYYSTNSQLSNSNIFTNQTSAGTTTSGITYFGVVSSMTSNTIVAIHDDSISPPSINDFIMFEKDKRVNSSSLIGYYADVKLVNNSKKKIELFSLGSEISESSK